MRKLALLILLFTLSLPAEVLLGRQNLNLSLHSGGNSLDESQRAWLLGGFLTGPLNKIIPGAASYLWLGGQGEYGIWEHDSKSIFDLESSYSTNLLILVHINDALNFGPGIGICGIIPRTSTMPSSVSGFTTAYSFSAFLRFLNTPLGIAYKYLIYAKFEDTDQNLYISSHNFYIFLDFSYAPKENSPKK